MDLLFGACSSAVLQQVPEVWRAGTQHDPVRLDRLPACHGQCHVHERPRLEELVEHRGQVGLVVVPTEAELLPMAKNLLIYRYKLPV